jgi:hypothetical protein
MYIADRIRARPPGAGRGSKEFAGALTAASLSA